MHLLVSHKVKARGRVFRLVGKLEKHPYEEVLHIRCTNVPIQKNNTASLLRPQLSNTSVVQLFRLMDKVKTVQKVA